MPFTSRISRLSGISFFSVSGAQQRNRFLAPEVWGYVPAGHAAVTKALDEERAVSRNWLAGQRLKGGFNEGV